MCGGGTLNTFYWALSVFQSCSIFLFGQKRVLILLSRKPRSLEDSLRALLSFCFPLLTGTNGNLGL